MPTVFAKAAGLTCNTARTRFACEFVNPESGRLSEIELTLRLPAGYAVGQTRVLSHPVAAGSLLRHVWRVTPPDGTAANAPIVAVVQIDAVRADGARVRYYQTLDLP